MWDNNTPLQLLNSMPKVLKEEHLEKLQMLLEADKYKNQLVSGYELCGAYAPFCNGCDKGKKFPCATAYVNFMKEGGLDIGIDPAVSGEAADGNENADYDLKRDFSFGDEAAEPKSAEKKKIRIAIARKKTL